MESPDLLTHLFAQKILTPAQKAKVENLRKNDSEAKAVEKLLEFVAKKGKPGLMELIKGYRVANTHHMADRLIDALPATEKADLMES